MKRTLTLFLAIGLALLIVTLVDLTLRQPSAAAYRPPLEKVGETEAMTVTVVGAIGQDQIQPLLDAFTARTGFVAAYEQNGDLAHLGSCQADGDCPDVAMVPQPGLLRELAAEGALLDLSTFVSPTLVQTNYSQTWIDLGSVGGTLYGVWFNANNKSLVWYDPSEFAAHGWTTPTTWAETIALSEEISDTTGTPPWSIGNESGTATGWPLTDWLEDILLRSAGPDIYDALIAHEIPWTHTQVLSVMTHFGDVFGNEAYQLGGKAGTLNTSFADAACPPFVEPPEAFLHHQGSFAQDWIPDCSPGQIARVDYAVFPFPDIDPAHANAVMGGGDLAMAFNSNAGAQALINYLITTDAADVWIAQGHTSPNRSADLNLYADPIARSAAEQLVNADIFRCDLTDQLPWDLNAYVWSQMDDLVRAAPDPAATERVLTRIELKASPQTTMTFAGSYSHQSLGPVFDEFLSRTLITVQYRQLDDSGELRGCAAASTCPDVALLDSPALMADLVGEGALVDLSSVVSPTLLEDNYSEVWIDAGKIDGTLHGLWFEANSKSLIWYDPSEFAAHGWTTPTTWAETMALCEQISNTTGTPPWSIGNESGTGTGWPLTDWFEDILLRSAGPDIYDDLIAHNIHWTHTEILSAMMYFGDVFGYEEYQLGGKEGTLNTNFADAMLPPFDDSPTAYLHRQGEFAQVFISSEFPDQVPGVDYGVFPFPEIAPAYAGAVMGAGQTAVAFNAGERTQKLLNYLVTKDAAELWIREGHTSPNRNADRSLYPDPVTRAAAEQLVDADIFRFDLTDQLAGDLNWYVWKQMDDLVRAAPDDEAMRRVLERIEWKASGTLRQVFLPITLRAD